MELLLEVLTPQFAAGVCLMCLCALTMRCRYELRHGGRGAVLVFLSQSFCVAPYLAYYLAVGAGVVPASYQIVIPRILTLNLILQIATMALFPMLMKISAAGIRQRFKREKP